MKNLISKFVFSHEADASKAVRGEIVFYEACAEAGSAR